MLRCLQESPLAITYGDEDVENSSFFAEVFGLLTFCERALWRGSWLWLKDLLKYVCLD